MVANFGFDAEDGARHVTLDTGLPGAGRAMVSVCDWILRDGGMTPGADRIRLRPESAILLDLRIVNVPVATGARGGTPEKALALPEADGVVCSQVSVGDVPENQQQGPLVHAGYS